MVSCEVQMWTWPVPGPSIGNFRFERNAGLSSRDCCGVPALRFRVPCYVISDIIPCELLFASAYFAGLCFALVCPWLDNLPAGMPANRPFFTAGFPTRQASLTFQTDALPGGNRNVSERRPSRRVPIGAQPCPSVVQNLRFFPVAPGRFHRL